MQIDITDFFMNECPKDSSASVSEIGWRVGADTWWAALEAAEEYPLLKSYEEWEAFKSYVSEMGAWSDDEIDSWGREELTALLIQLISSDMREAGLSPKSTGIDWAAYELKDELSHAIFKADDGRVYYTY